MRRLLRRLGRARIGRALALLCGGLLPSCGWLPPEEAFALAFVVTDAGGQPVEGATVSVGHAVAGHTPPSGTLRFVRPGRRGERLEVAVACPRGLAPSPAHSVLVLRATAGGVLEHALRCRPVPPETVIVVHAPGASDLPVMVDGLRVGKTDARGVAHVLLREPPGTRVEIALDTSSAPHLLPQSPRQAFSVGAQSQALVFHRHFR